jgi:hypothetical protein
MQETAEPINSNFEDLQTSHSRGVMVVRLAVGGLLAERASPEPPQALRIEYDVR